MQKFICCSDTHGIPPRFDENKFGPESEHAAWLHAGDFYNRVRSYGWVEWPALRRWHAERQIPVHMVRGNHDCKDTECVQGKCSIEGIVTKIAPKLFVVGIGWSGNDFFDLPGESDLMPVCSDVLRQAMFKMQPGDHSIVVSHYPALIKEVYGDVHSPEGWMFDCVAKVLDALRPLALVTGHIHELFGQAGTWNGTLLLHPGDVPGVLTVNDDGKATFEFGDR